MSLASKILKKHFEFSQFSIGMVGGLLFCIMVVLSKIISPLKRLLKVYKHSAPTYSSLLMAIFSTSFLLLIFFSSLLLRSEINIQKFAVFFLVSFIFLTPWAFLALDLFAYYKRFRSDRKK